MVKSVSRDELRAGGFQFTFINTRDGAEPAEIVMRASGVDDPQKAATDYIARFNLSGGDWILSGLYREPAPSKRMF